MFENMAAAKYPSRIRYEESHPCVTVRVSKEDRERLDEIGKKLGMSNREILMRGAGLIEKDLEAEKKRIREATKKAYEQAWGQAQEEALMNVEIGTCSDCGEVIEWDLTDPLVQKILDDLVNSKSFCHGECLEKRRRRGR
ncbi:DUF7576 family protein [Methanomassiliicoccus luminyensis]|uniref:DUF7576 family protein n=2 Tax=Methanomassiliicoccus luminyensis TaxID=1080712 RepID=UPI001F2D2C23|nr:hypothetical protein [Methanomassiliicoccus luminyensis]